MQQQASFSVALPDADRNGWKSDRQSVESRLSAYAWRAAVADIDPVRETVDPKDVASHFTLKAWWSETAAGIETGVTPSEEIAALEDRYGVSLPTEFREYLKWGVPIAENWDTEDGNWWPIERIKNIPDEYDHSVSEPIARNAAKHLIFLDYSIWSWAWAISCANDDTRGKVALIGGMPDGYVADSFEEFVQRYTTDWVSISQVHASTARAGSFWRWLRRR